MLMGLQLNAVIAFTLVI